MCIRDSHKNASPAPIIVERKTAISPEPGIENKYLRAHAEMQNIQRRANEERQQLQMCIRDRRS